MAEQSNEPQQQRSREKVARILAATAALLENTPYQEIGTKLIAAEAGVSVGILYRYFADREAIVAALLHTWLQADLATVERLAAGPLPADRREFLATVFAAYADRFRTVPGYRQLWYHGPRIAAVQAESKETDARIAEHVHRALVTGYALPDTPDSLRRTHLAVSVASHLLDLAFCADRDGDPAVLADAALMLELYLFAPAAASS
ncbi:TetR/AcrR family transcriptional regulator [Kitasatospora sp. NPDC002227]|uniref:TetR/AcrR family transcriptional regulator n=1 Tax=Kitasatospora sp. NPDC002227 TaxID=3154773 RepID=UPI003333F49D